MLLQNRNAFGHAFIKDIAGNAGDKPLQPTFPDKGGRPRSLLFFMLQPHRPKTRHQGQRFCRGQPNAIGGTCDQNLLVVHGTAING